MQEDWQPVPLRRQYTCPTCHDTLYEVVGHCRDNMEIHHGDRQVRSSHINAWTEHQRGHLFWCKDCNEERAVCCDIFMRITRTFDGLDDDGEEVHDGVIQLTHNRYYLSEDNLDGFTVTCPLCRSEYRYGYKE